MTWKMIWQRLLNLYRIFRAKEVFCNTCGVILLQAESVYCYECVEQEALKPKVKVRKQEEIIQEYIDNRLGFNTYMHPGLKNEIQGALQGLGSFGNQIGQNQFGQMQQSRHQWGQLGQYIPTYEEQQRTMKLMLNSFGQKQDETKTS